MCASTAAVTVSVPPEHHFARQTSGQSQHRHSDDLAWRDTDSDTGGDRQQTQREVGTQASVDRVDTHTGLWLSSEHMACCKANSDENRERFITLVLWSNQG